MAPRALPALLAGDFNMLPGSPEHQRLLAPFAGGIHPWRDCRQLALPGRRPMSAGFDYVFASADLAGQLRRVRLDDGAGGAEHGPVAVELDWG